MTLSVLLLAFLFSSILGLVFHVIVGGRGWRILFYLFLSWLGFILGNGLGGSIGWEIWNVGMIKTIPASLGSIILLLLGWWLGKVQKRTGV
jgi:hypothetical protein